MKNKPDITLRSFVFGALFTVVFAVLTIYFANVKNICVSASQIPILPYLLLFAMVLVVNPLCRLVRFVRPFSPAELLIMLVMGVVTAGLSTFGLSAQVVPIMANLFNPQWNSAQSEWSRYVEPFVNEQFFVAEPGIRDQAIVYAREIAVRNRQRAIYDAATGLVRADEHVTEAMAAHAASVAAGNELTISTAASLLRAARESQAQASNTWHGVRADDPALQALSPAQTAEQYAARVAEQETRVNAARAALAELEQRAFDRVQVFRRGLPKDMRAYPGFLLMADDSAASYLARLSRCVHGRRALAALRDVYTDPGATAADIARAADAALTELARVNERTRVTAEQQDVTRRADDLRAQTIELSGQLSGLYEQQRFANRAEGRKIASETAHLERLKRSLTKKATQAQQDLDLVSRRLAVADTLDALAGELTAIRQDAQAVAPPAAALRSRIATAMRQFPALDTSLRRMFAGDVPWSAWRAPLLRWGTMIVLTYLILMTFNILIFRQWAHNEKLIYPLAELSEELAGAGQDSVPGAVPQAYRTALFWVGALVPGIVLGWNLFVYTQIVPGLTTINLDNGWGGNILNTMLAGLYPSAKSTIFFTMIGLSFLIPKKISFSLWFFTILYMIQLLIIVGLGYGVDERSFQDDWVYTLNFRTAEGGGALLVFSAVVLFKCRRYILCCFQRSAVADLEPAEQTELRVSSLLFLAGSAGIVLFMWRGMGANLGHAVFFYVIVLLVTIGLIRAVTEGGILGFQAWSGPFHFIRSMAGMTKAWTAPALFSPLMLYYIVFFFDLKTFIAPAMATGIKIRSDLGLSRRNFHLAMAGAIVIGVIVSVGVEIMMGYSRGADNMNGWFHSALPQITYVKMTDMVRNPPDATPAERLWVVAGAVTMAGLLYLRRSFFWLPHPLGLIMLVNPIMRTYWFSILLGWLAKSLVTKYGSKNAYARARYFFIGLIAGELFVVAAALILSVTMKISIPIDLNRN